MVCARLASPTSGPASVGLARGKDAERDADRRGDQRRDDDQHDVLAEPRRAARRGATRGTRGARSSESRLQQLANVRVVDMRQSGPASRTRRSAPRAARRRDWPARTPRSDRASRAGRPAASSPAAHETRVQLGARDRIERAERLVHQQHRRIGRERARQADALPLAAGQLVRPARAKRRRLEADQRQQFVDARGDTRRVPLRAAAARRRCCRRR